MARNAHPTKSGPGRRHKNGEKHGKPPVPAKGPWLGQHVATAARQRRREIVALIGIRQFKKLQRQQRAEP